MAEHNDNPGSNEQSTETQHAAGTPQHNQEAVLFDEQTVMSRGQAPESGDKVAFRRTGKR